MKQEWCHEIFWSRVLFYRCWGYRRVGPFDVWSICKRCFDLTHRFRSFPLNNFIDDTVVSRNMGLSIPVIVDEVAEYYCHWCWTLCELFPSKDFMLTGKVMVDSAIWLLNLGGLVCFRLGNDALMFIHLD